MAEISVRIRAIDEATPAMKKMAAETSTLRGSFDGLTQTLNNVAGAFGIGLNIGSAVGMVKNMITSSFELAAAMEQSEMAFTTMLGSAEQATSMLQQLRDFADKTPFEFVGLQEAAKRMMAYGFAAEDVIPTLTAVGDAAAALGGGQPMIERLTTALGQMSAKGKVSGEELRQLAEAGVPALRYLADAAGVTTGEMSKMIEKGLVPADKAVKVLLQSMKQDFGGLMAKQAETATGKLSTMKDALSGLGTEVGRSFIPNVKAGADIVTYFAKTIKDALEATNKETDQIALLKEAVKQTAITEQQYADVVRTQVITAQNDVGFAFTRVRETINDTTAATDLLRVAGVNHANSMAQSETRFVAMYDAIEVTTKATLDLGDGIDLLAIKADQLKDITGMLAGAYGFFNTETEKSEDTQESLEKKMAKLTTAHGKNYAALLAGKGTIVDNTREIARAEIANQRLGTSLTELDVKYANQDNINKYNDAVFQSNEVIKKMTAENVNGRVSNEDLAAAIEKSDERLGQHKERLEASFMSAEKYNLEVREGALDTLDSTEKLAELNKEHGTGFTAVQLAQGAQRKYNEEMGILKQQLADAKKAEEDLLVQTATRIKESIVLKLIEKLSDEGLTAEEIARVQKIRDAYGLQASEEVNNMISVQNQSTILHELIDGHQLDFITGEENKASAAGVAIDYIVKKNKEGIIPTLGDVTKVAEEAYEKLKLFADTYGGLHDKTIKITTEYYTVNKGDVRISLAGGPVQVSEPGLSVKVNNKVAEDDKFNKEGYAHGGWMHGGGGPYMVGEQGPELFNPAYSGTVMPNHMLGGGGGNGSLNISTVNLYGVQNTSQLFEQLSREARARGLKFSKN